MMIPTIHTNGTARDDLIEQVTSAMDKGRAFIQAMQAMAPHGRDYHPQGSGALAAATLENEARIAIVQSVIDDLNAMAEAIADA